MKTSSGHDKISCIILKEVKDIIAQTPIISSQPGFQHWCVPVQIKARKSNSTFQKGGQNLNRKLQTYIIASMYV